MIDYGAASIGYGKIRILAPTPANMPVLDGPCSHTCKPRMIQRGRIGSGHWGHEHVVWGRSDNVYPTLQLRRWKCEEQLQNTYRLQRACMENFGEEFRRFTSSSAKCSYSKFPAWPRTPDSSACLNKKQSSVPHMKNWSYQQAFSASSNQPTLLSSYGLNIKLYARINMYNTIRTLLMRQSPTQFIQVHETWKLQRKQKGLTRRRKKNRIRCTKRKKEYCLAVQINIFWPSPQFSHQDI